jgi:manganese efflux pump family protein
LAESGGENVGLGPLSFWYTLGIAFGLAMDAFAVSVAAGIQVTALDYRHVSRLALSFGFFQFFMPVIGWLAGRGLSQWVGAVDHWIAFALLAAIGGKMLWESVCPPENPAQDPTRGWTLLILSVATSIDALAVGLSLAFLEVSIWVPSLVIGVVAAILSAVGAFFGSRLGRRFGVWAERFGGLVLIAIGVRILVSHLF